MIDVTITLLMMSIICIYKVSNSRLWWYRKCQW